MPTKYRRMRLAASRRWLAALLPLSWWLGGCATTLPPSTPVPPPQIPQPPAQLMTPPEPDSFLERAQKNIEAWRLRLTGSETR